MLFNNIMTTAILYFVIVGAAWSPPAGAGALVEKDRNLGFGDLYVQSLQKQSKNRNESQATPTSHAAGEQGGGGRQVSLGTLPRTRLPEFEADQMFLRVEVPVCRSQ